MYTIWRTFTQWTFLITGMVWLTSIITIRLISYRMIRDHLKYHNYHPFSNSSKCEKTQYLAILAQECFAKWCGSKFWYWFQNVPMFDAFCRCAFPCTSDCISGDKFAHWRRQSNIYLGRISTGSPSKFEPPYRICKRKRRRRDRISSDRIHPGSCFKSDRKYGRAARQRSKKARRVRCPKSK